ncbi:MAG: DUF5050 domain-containing protein [Clostridiaceae bacterium]|nr:DUF5050 domain-containing protein [Clostridiaceae bacterium]
MKKTAFFLIALVLLLLMSYSAFAKYNIVKGEVNVYVNDSKIIFDTQPVYINNRTMVPIRGVFEAMGATVEWDNNRKIVTIEKDIKIQVQLDNPKALVDGETVIMDVPPAGIDGRILVPVRFISEALDAEVEWVNSTKTVFIKSDYKNADSGNIQNWGKFSSDETWNYYIINDYVLLRENKNSRKLEKVADYIVGDLHINDEWIYCVGIDKGIKKPVRINKITREKEVIADFSVDSVLVVNNWVYYSISEDETILYRTKTDGSATEKILENGDFSPKSWLVHDGWIYFRNLKDKSISRARTDGSEITKLTELYVAPVSVGNTQVSDEYSLEIKLIDKDYIYLLLENAGYMGKTYYTPGVYRVPVKGGSPVIITENVPVSINMDKQWLYMAVEINNRYRLVKVSKSGSELITINEYKQNDIPKNIYINDSTLIYSLLRGTDEMDELFFIISSQGGNISTFSTIYGNDYYRVKEILTAASAVNEKLDSYSMLQISTSGKDTGKNITSEKKVSNAQSLYYQRIKQDDREDYIMAWVDKMYLYSKYGDETQWNIEESPLSGKSKLQSVFDYIQPTQELCNNLNLISEYGKYVLKGKGAFTEIIGKLIESDILVYDYSNSFIDSISLEIAINRNSNFTEEVTLEINYYDTIDAKSYTDRYQFVAGQFNSIYINRPPELFQAVNDKNRAVNNIEHGKKKLNEGKYDDAIALFDIAIGLYAKAYDAYLYKGEALYRLGKYEEAILTYDQYIKLNPKDIEALTLKGMCYLKLGNLNRAEMLAKTVLQTDENSVKAYNLAGDIAFEREDYGMAYEYYNKAITLDPYFYDSHIQIINVLFNARNYTKCISSADEFLKRFPGDRNILFTKARCLSYQGNSIDAIEVFKEILLFDPSNDFVTMTYIALEYENLQDYSKAREFAERAQAVYADYSLLKYLIQKLEYDISTSPGQKLIDFLRNNYLYYNESVELKKALDNFIAKGNNFNTGDVRELIEAIKSPEDTSTSIITGVDFKSLLNYNDKSFMEVKEETDAIYIKINSFTNKSGLKFSEYIQSLTDTKNKTLLLDLRDNTGGLSAEANAMLDALLGECNASYLIDRDGYMNVFNSDKNHVAFKKIGVLVNENTAESSELLVLGLKTYLNNVTIIGRKTMGRGTGQILYLDRVKEYAIFLVNHYWNVKQENIHGKGIMPDIAVDDNETDLSEAIELFLKGS